MDAELTHVSAGPGAPRPEPVAVTPGSGVALSTSGMLEVGAGELTLVLADIERRYGYDFRDYAYASLKRRFRQFARNEHLASMPELRECVLERPDCMARLLNTVSVSVTSMFRDPGCYLALREKVVPRLRSAHSIRVWVAGCATGEEAYSLAILLKEEGLCDSARIYATDLVQPMIDAARAGIFSTRKMPEFTRNYMAAGGTRPFCEYYSAEDDCATLASALQANIVWAVHNLVTDGSFNEFQVIFCRNVMIYFTAALQVRVHKLLYDSLAVGGFLVVGSHEAIAGSPHEDCYAALDVDARIYRKVK